MIKPALFCLLTFYFCLAECSLPSLESRECADARVVAKQFYSFHLANDMRPTVDNLKLRERYLMPRFYSVISANAGGATDPFTLASEFPTTFKIGECRPVSTTRVDLQIQLYWRDYAKTMQEAVIANMVYDRGGWLIESVSSKGK